MTESISLLPHKVKEHTQRPRGIPDESTSDGVHSRGDSCQQPATRALSPYTRCNCQEGENLTVGQFRAKYSILGPHDIRLHDVEGRCREA